MERSNVAPEGMVVTPHHLATQSAVAILREGGTAMEATVAAAATLAVVYPHMNGIGGDGFWLIIPPSKKPIVIEACGSAGSLANLNFFQGLTEIPFIGPKSANTVAGTIGGWQEALNYVEDCGYERISISRLLSDAIKYAETGFSITESQEESLKILTSTEQVSKQFSEVFLPEGKVPKVGERFCQKNLAKTSRYLAENGLDSFYRGELGKLIAVDLEYLGLPITESDLANYVASRKAPLRLLHSKGELFNSPPPTQGLVSLAIHGILDKLNVNGKNKGEFIHMTVEATKQAFKIRDDYLTDPNYMKKDPEDLLSDSEIYKMAANVDPNKAGSGIGKGPGDTIWLGVMDNKGFSVSFIQSLYHQFGSGVVLPHTGILWHNRGTSFTLEEEQLLSIKPGKKPFHTLNTPGAILKDGRTIVYGTRGGDGQAQTQAAIFYRYVIQELPLQRCVSMPRWLFGRTAGNQSSSLKLENRFSEETLSFLKDRGHDIVKLPEFSEDVGQAGILVRHPNGMIEGAFDPRSNGSAAGF